MLALAFLQFLLHLIRSIFKDCQSYQAARSALNIVDEFLGTKQDARSFKYLWSARKLVQSRSVNFSMINHGLGQLHA
jgi:hypothetical protein